MEWLHRLFTFTVLFFVMLIPSGIFLGYITGEMFHLRVRTRIVLILAGAASVPLLLVFF